MRGPIRRNGSHCTRKQGTHECPGLQQAFKQMTQAAEACRKQHEANRDAQATKYAAKRAESTQEAERLQSRDIYGFKLTSTEPHRASATAGEATLHERIMQSPPRRSLPQPEPCHQIEPTPRTARRLDCLCLVDTMRKNYHQHPPINAILQELTSLQIKHIQFLIAARVGQALLERSSRRPVEKRPQQVLGQCARQQRNDRANRIRPGFARGEGPGRVHTREEAENR